MPILFPWDTYPSIPDSFVLMMYRNISKVWNMLFLPWSHTKRDKHLEMKTIQNLRVFLLWNLPSSSSVTSPAKDCDLGIFYNKLAENEEEEALPQVASSSRAKAPSKDQAAAASV